MRFLYHKKKDTYIALREFIKNKTDTKILYSVVNEFGILKTNISGQNKTKLGDLNENLIDEQNIKFY